MKRTLLISIAGFTLALFTDVVARTALSNRPKTRVSPDWRFVFDGSYSDATKTSVPATT